MPCGGADLQVLVPLEAALGSTDELAEQVGHGVLEPDLLAELLLSAPGLSVVWVDEHGTPVGTDPRRWTAQRGDAADVRRLLLQIAALPPPAQRYPRHPTATSR